MDIFIVVIKNTKLCLILRNTKGILQSMYVYRMWIEDPCLTSGIQRGDSYLSSIMCFYWKRSLPVDAFWLSKAQFTVVTSIFCRRRGWSFLHSWAKSRDGAIQSVFRFPYVGWGLRYSLVLKIGSLPCVGMGLDSPLVPLSGKSQGRIFLAFLKLAFLQTWEWSFFFVGSSILDQVLW